MDDIKSLCPGLNDEQIKELKSLQKKSLEILTVFKEFCDKHNLLFYFCGGCCIGTLRHKGFIPWDDDVDVFMPREDYEKLAKLWNTENDGRFIYCRSNESKFYRMLMAYIVDDTTSFIRERQTDLDIPHGVRLEIFPLDGCPDSRFKRKIQIFWALLYQLYMNQEAPTSKGKLFEFVGKLCLAMVPSWKNRYKIVKFAEKQMSKYPFGQYEKITELCGRYQYMVNEYPRTAFESAVYKEFEGMEMPIPVGYGTYLKMAFGDYMQFPPKEQRVPKHEAVCIDVDNSYRKYKGKYYLND